MKTGLSLDLNRTALLLIDFQEEQRAHPLYRVSGFDGVIANAARLLAAAREAPCRVIHAAFRRDFAKQPPRPFEPISDDGRPAFSDVTDPMTADRFPMRRPHPELNPFQPPDRIALGAPVVAVAFARHDFPLTRVKGVSVPNAKTGLLCNPNPNLDPQGDPADLGVYYRANSTDPTVGLGPGRLRGVFAFATLSNGQIVAIDVDDWDAPCRRPLNVGRGRNRASVTCQSAPVKLQPSGSVHSPWMTVSASSNWS